MTAGSVRSHYHLLPRRWQDLKEIYHPVRLHHSGKHAENQAGSYVLSSLVHPGLLQPKRQGESLDSWQAWCILPLDGSR